MEKLSLKIWPDSCKGGEKHRGWHLTTDWGSEVLEKSLKEKMPGQWGQVVVICELPITLLWNSFIELEKNRGLHLFPQKCICSPKGSFLSLKAFFDILLTGGKRQWAGTKQVSCTLEMIQRFSFSYFSMCSNFCIWDYVKVRTYLNMQILRYSSLTNLKIY